MKTQFLNKRLADLLLVLLFFISCSKSNTDSPEIQALSEEANDTPLITSILQNYCKSDTTCLWAGQTINAGSVVISNDATNLYITVNSKEGFQAVNDNIKIWVGNDLANLPANTQNVPIPGQFPYKYTANGTSFTVTIPFNQITVDGAPITCDKAMLYVFVHVDAIAAGGAETAWGGCIPGTNTNRWYFYANYTTACCTTPPPVDCYSQTAFAKGGWVFTTDKKSNPENLPSLGLAKNRWGWAINIKMPGTTVYNIWAGAGLNNTSKGRLAGQLTVNWDGTMVTVNYQLANGFRLVETHVFAGDNKPAIIAPGQYGNTMSFDPPVASYSGTYMVTDTNFDGIWIIAHAGVFSCY